MWNYRIVRRKNVYVGPDKQKERTDYTYAIHEAYYDRSGYVRAITQDSVEPFGNDVEELRHSWVMMAEAFGLPILDYDSIPEPGYQGEDDPIWSAGDELEAGIAKALSREEARSRLQEWWEDFDEVAYEKQVEEARVEKERIHTETFTGTPTFDELVKKLYSDYREHRKRNDAAKPCK